MESIEHYFSNFLSYLNDIFYDKKTESSNYKTKPWMAHLKKKQLLQKTF